MTPKGSKEPHLFDLPIATGDYLRLYRYTWARFDDDASGPLGYNGHVVKVLGRTDDGLKLQNSKGQIGEVEWRRMIDPTTKRLALGFGHALTIDAAQGITADEHINALPRGSAGVTAFKAYVAESRARGTTWTLISEAAVLEAEKRSRALGDARPIESDDLWKRVGADFAHKPYKSLAVDLVEATRRVRERAIDSFVAQSHTLHTWAAAGKDAGEEARTKVEERAFVDRLADHLAAFAAEVCKNAALIRETFGILDKRLPGKLPEDAAPKPELAASPKPPTSSPGF